MRQTFKGIVCPHIPNPVTVLRLSRTRNGVFYFANMTSQVTILLESQTPTGKRVAQQLIVEMQDVFDVNEAVTVLSDYHNYKPNGKRVIQARFFDHSGDANG